MNNMLFERNYTSFIEPKYGTKRNVEHDEQMTHHIQSMHIYSIHDDERVDMTGYDTYSIDPLGCKDADDAFSVFYENTKLFLAIHIADPTEFIDLHSDLWRDIEKRITTKYPSNRPPIHMMPPQVLDLASLLGSHDGCNKKAITILTEIDPTTYAPIHEIKMIFSKVLVKQKNGYSYCSAASVADKLSPFMIGLKISETLKTRRALKTKGIKLNDVSTAYPIYDEDGVHLYEDPPCERLMKQMIAEFAIFANSFVGEYLKINLNTGIFRTCDTKQWLQSIYSHISGEELLQEIITNGIRADYMSHVQSHDLVGMPEYCHFTSPIRRLSDCVCHYLLKYIYFKHTRKLTHYDIPFSEETLDKLATKCMNVTRNDKKNQYADIKFRLLQVMDNMIFFNQQINLEYYITGYSGLFLNIIICRINTVHVHMSYTLRVRNYNKDIHPKEKHKVIVRHVNCFTRYDENTIPELDKAVLE